jgi:hypothetical protein
MMKNKNIITKVDTVPKTNINVNSFMKKSKRNKENILSDENIITDSIIPDVIPDVIPDKVNVKFLNLIKARTAKQINIQNKNSNREEKIINLINEIKQEEMIKVEIKTEKLKNKLMKLM